VWICPKHTLNISFHDGWVGAARFTTGLVGLGDAGVLFAALAATAVLRGGMSEVAEVVAWGMKMRVRCVIGQP
jgi:hypothetical protein